MVMVLAKCDPLRVDLVDCVASKRHKVGQFLTHATQKRSEFVCYSLKIKNAPQKAVRGLDVLEEINMNTNEG